MNKHQRIGLILLVCAPVASACMQSLDSSGITGGTGGQSLNSTYTYTVDGGEGGTGPGPGSGSGGGSTSSSGGSGVGGGSNGAGDAGQCQNGFIIDPSTYPVICTDNTNGGNSPIVTQTPGIELPDGGTAVNPCDLLEIQSLAVRAQYCSSCHGVPGISSAPFHSMMVDQDVDGGPTLLTTQSVKVLVPPDAGGGFAPLVIPGDPDNSVLYQRVSSGTMPPSIGINSSAMPTVSDIALLRAWIQNLPTCLNLGSSAGATSSAGDGGSTADASGSSSGSGSSSDSGTVTDRAQYNFEADVQGWAGNGPPISGVATSITEVFAGRQSLAVSFNGAAGTRQVLVNNPATPAGAVVTYHVWIPAGSTITAVQPFVQAANRAGGLTGTSVPIANVSLGAWNTITVTVPANAVTPLSQLGVQFTTNGPWVGIVYVDSIGW